MIDLIKRTSVFIRSNVESDEALKAAVALAELIEGKISVYSTVLIISSLLKSEFEIKDCVPNEATAFVITSIRELYKSLTERNLVLANEIADVLQALPENKYYKNKRSISDFNKVYIKQFNKKHRTQLPFIA
ncbi:hypothetical protein [Ruminococcus sp.]|uniref:hypothetical protein n=1 Tax=Ruminococcus sp. TaxID=41978 RepID=UPI001B55AC10|nr:hypothetical protein [Ruminococcus sp.]MBP5433380.1 hypothetical protein [Ruminococcus sp.]